MHTSQKLLCLIIGLSILSCSSNSEGESIAGNVDSISDEFVSYNLAVDTPILPIRDLIETIEFTRLQETNESLLSNANNYVQYDGNIVFSGSEGNVYAFTGTGELIRRINRKGDGPEEYSGVQDLWMQGDSIGIYTRGKYIKWYDLEGNFLDAVNVDVAAGHMIPYGNGYAMDAGYAVLDDSLRFNFAYVDKEFNTKDTFVPAGELPNMRVFTSNSTLQTYQEKVLFHRMMSDTIYAYDETYFTPFMHFDLGDDWAFKDIEKFSDQVFSQVTSSGKAWNIVSLVSERMVYISLFGGESGKNKMLIDRLTGEKVKVDLTIPESDESISLFASYWLNGELHGSIQSPDVAILISMLEEGRYSFNEGTTLEEIESSENPVLVRVKFKDSSEW